MLYVNDEIFGPGRQMWRPVMERSMRPWIKSQSARYRRPGYRRVKWLWIARHLTQKTRHTVERKNRHFVRQHDRMVGIIRPGHLRRPMRKR